MKHVIKITRSSIMVYMTITGGQAAMGGRADGLLPVR